MRQLLLLFIVVINIVRADALPENTLKAAYLYNFALLTDWPKEDASRTFNLCFFREDFGAASDALNNKMIRNRKINVLSVTSAEEARQCQMVFIRDGEEQEGEKLIQKLSGLPVLVVSENPRINDAHIIVLRENRKLAFDISLKEFKEADLSVSSKLLKLARKVEP